MIPKIISATVTTNGELMVVLEDGRIFIQGMGSIWRELTPDIEGVEEFYRK